MISRYDLIARVDHDIETHPPDTGYTKRAIRAVCEANLPNGTNLGVQFALQYDGKETDEDLVNEIAEKQTPYLASNSLDRGGDCADFCRNLIRAITGGKWIGDWTEGIYSKYKNHQVPWEERRPLDILLNKFSDRNPHATHAMLCIGCGKMLHTRSVSKPLQVTSDTLYSVGSRTGTGVFRVLTDEEYNQFIINNNDIEKGEVMKVYKNGIEVAELLKGDTLSMTVDEVVPIPEPVPTPVLKKVVYTGSGASIRTAPKSTATKVGLAKNGDVFETNADAITAPYTEIVYNGKVAYAYNKGGNYFKWA